MADNANPEFMADLEFCRYNVISGKDEYMGTTVYSVADMAETTDNMKAQGWTRYMTSVVIG